MPLPQKPLEPQSLEEAKQTIGQLSQVIEMQQAEIERWRAKTDDLKGNRQRIHTLQLAELIPLKAPKTGT